MQHRVCLYCDAWGIIWLYKPKDAYRQYYFLCGDHYSNEKTKKSKNKIDVFCIFGQRHERKTPVKQNSGRGIVKDSTVSRIQDIYSGDKKDDV